MIETANRTNAQAWLLRPFPAPITRKPLRRLPSHFCLEWFGDPVQYNH
jgi:hypothetical protein